MLQIYMERRKRKMSLTWTRYDNLGCSSDNNLTTWQLQFGSKVFVTLMMTCRALWGGFALSKEKTRRRKGCVLSIKQDKESSINVFVNAFITTALFKTLYHTSFNRWIGRSLQNKPKERKKKQKKRTITIKKKHFH